MRRVMFLRNDKNYNPVGCVAFSVSKDKKRLRYQVSTLNPVDNFERSLARHIALGRLLEKPFVIKNLVGDETPYELSYIVMSCISNNGNLPNRARRAARSWLKSNQWQTEGDSE